MLPQFVEYNGEQDALKATIEEYKEEYWNYILGFMSFCPILNLFSAISLIYWYVTCILNS